MLSASRRPIGSAVFACLLAAVFAVAATLSVPAAATVTARLADPQTASSIFGAAAAYAAAQPGVRELARALDPGDAISRGKDGRLTILLVGSDYRPKLAGERTDTLMVVTIHPGTKQVSAVSIPRDIARVRLPNGTTYKGRINTIYAYYRKTLGAAGALGRLQKIIEFNLQIEIDYYALIRMPGFEALIDHIAGVTVSVPREIRDGKFWDDPRGPQGIYFPASSSWQLRGRNSTLCNGYYKTGQLSKPGARCQRALVYARSRKGKANSDFKRALRQQDIVAAAITKVRQRGQGNLGALLSAGNQQVANGNVITNIPRTSANVLELFNLFAGAKLANKAVLRPKKYATRISGTSTFRLKLAEVRALTKAWFAPVK